MKKFVFLFVIGFIQLSFSQVVQIQPAFATENDSIVIILDASQAGASELLNFTGTIYAHTGVTVDSLGIVKDWQWVIAAWNANISRAALVRLSTNLYKFTIGFPRQFYKITNPNVKITKLDFVFRSSDDSKQTRPDIFIPLSEKGLNVSIVLPDKKPTFINLNDSIKVLAISSGAIDLNLFINDSLVSSVMNDTLEYYLKANNYVKKRIKAEAVMEALHALDSTYIIIRTPDVVEVSPPGIKNGINYTSSTSVTFSLYAPEHQNVYVIGDFSNWEVDPKYKMNVSPDHFTYWLPVDSLIPKKEYICQYLVDESLRIADPYSEKISDPSNDSYISNSTYPNLIKYPTGKSTEIASVIQTDRIPYQWQTTNFVRPKKGDLVIYELLMRDFIAEHDYKTLTDTLNYFKRLGINAIELMPVMEFEGNESWGYNPDFMCALDKYYGPENDFKKFIDAAHQMGIAVILDIVLNHQYGQSPLVRLWWDAANNRPASNSPYFNATSPNTAYSFGYDFNHESSATKNYVDRVTSYWLTNYHIDGYRFDFTKGFTNTAGDGGAYDQSRINILERMADKIWDVDSTAYIILEHFTANSEETVLTNYGMMIWGNMNGAYQQAVMGYPSGPPGTWDLTGTSYKSRGWNEPGLVAYMESHDEERLMYKAIQYGNSSGGYNIKNVGTALNRIKLAAAFYLTIPGNKMIWQFGELGYDYSIDYNGRVGNKPIKWDYYKDPERLNLYKTFQALIELKKYNAFRSNNSLFDLTGAVKRINLYDSTMDVSIIGNFDVVQKDANPNFSKSGIWYDYFSGDTLSISNPTAAISLQPGEFHIYTTVKLPTPEEGILTGVESTENINKIIPASFSLEQNYPNPFNPTTKIRYSIPASLNSSKEGNFTQLKVYDLLGNEIITLVNKEQQPGNYEVNFNGTSLASGIYFYTIRIGSFVSTKKMVLLK